MMHEFYGVAYQCWDNGTGTMANTVAQHLTSMELIYRVCWVQVVYPPDHDFI